MTTNKIYISGALMGARDLNQVKEIYSLVADVCSRAGYQPYLPHLNTDPVKNRDLSDADVFSKDFAAMVDSAIVVSYIGEPSLGVGAELSICISKNIPIIAFVERKRKVSRFLRGMLQSAPNTEQIEFDDYHMLEQKLAFALQQRAKIHS